MNECLDKISLKVLSQFIVIFIILFFSVQFQKTHNNKISAMMQESEIGFQKANILC